MMTKIQYIINQEMQQNSNNKPALVEEISQIQGIARVYMQTAPLLLMVIP